MRLFAILTALILAGCVVSSGDRATGFVTPQVASGYIALEGRSYVVMEGRGAAFVVAPGIAVTNAHNAGIVGGAPVIGESRNYDLLFFRVATSLAAPAAEPRAGELVVAYGQGAHGELRLAHGVVRDLNAPVEARCATCLVQSAFTFEGNAGPGFSGGPVVDAGTGSVVGITFGYLDPNGRRLMYAYPISRVRQELATFVRP